MDPKDILNQLEDVRLHTNKRLSSLSQSQLNARPPQTEEEQPWSLGEVFMHIAMDEIYLRELISRPLREGMSPPTGVIFIPPSPPYGTSKDVIQFWLERARSQTRAFIAEWPSSWNPDIKHGGGLDFMNALEWLEGYAGHEAYHHRQIDELINWCGETGIT